MATERVDWRDGWLCIAYADTDWSTPVRYTMWWPVQRCDRRDVDHLVGLPAHGGAAGHYSARPADPPGATPVDLTLADGGRTLPIHQEREPIPPPPTRVQTRYRHGRWEKYLKARGWVTA